MKTFPRTETVERILSEETVAHRVALEVSQSVAAAFCEIARYNKDLAAEAIMTICLSIGGNVLDFLASIAMKSTSPIWDDERDSHPDSIGCSSEDGLYPEGCLDVCLAAALVTSSMSGLCEPSEEAGLVIKRWWSDILKNTPADELSEQIASMPRWPARKTKFLEAIDAMSNARQAESIMEEGGENHE